MTPLQLYILTAIEAVIWMILIMATTNKRFSDHLPPIAVGILSLILVEVSKIVLPNYIAILLAYIVIVIFIKVIDWIKFVKSLFICVFVFFLLAFIQAFFTVALGLFVEMQFVFEYGIIVMLASLATAGIIYFYVPLHIVIEALEKKDKLLYAVLGFSLIIVFYTHYITLLNERVNFAYNFAIATVALVLIIIGFYSVKKLLAVGEKNRAVKQYESFVVRAPGDIGNYTHMQAADWLAKINDQEKAKHHINNYLNNFEGSESLIHLERKILAIYLFTKMNQLKEAGFKCSLYINEYTIKHKMTDEKLIQSLEVLIDNAKEALETEGRDNEIRINIVQIDEEHSEIAIEVLNKHEAIEDYNIWSKFFKKGYTTRDGKKGLGLFKLDRLSKENRFQIVFENREIDNENYICFSILL